MQEPQADLPTRADLRHLWPVAIIAVAMVVAGCESSAPVIRQAKEQAAAGRGEDGLSTLSAALRQRPNDPDLRSAYLSLRDGQVSALLTEGAAVSREQPEKARALFERVLAIDSKNAKARSGLVQLERDASISKALAMAEQASDRKEDDQAMALLRQVLLQDPGNVQARRMMQAVEARSASKIGAQVRNDAMRRPVTIDFKEATLKQIFDLLAKTAGLNFVFDRDVRVDQKVSLSLKDKSVKDAIDVILLTSQLEQRVVDATTILVYPGTPAKLKDYQTLTMRTFFLAHADVEAVANTIKTLVKTRDVIVDKKQNMLIMRDTPESVRIAEQLVALHDLPEPEVMLEVEILEISRNRLTELGIKFPDQLSLSPLPSVAGGAITVNDLRNLNSGTVGVTVSPLSINAKGLDTDIKILANPRIRARNRETAKVLIGDKVPNITSTSTSTGFVAESVQYLDVGLKLDITPSISIDNEVAIKVSLEVSNIANQVKTSAGTLAYQIGTRTASTVLRLRDGENQVLAGLINDEDRRTANKVPGLGSVPLAGRLFSSQLGETRSTEIVLSITPRLIRNLTRPEPQLLEFDSGTESTGRGAGGTSVPIPAQPSAQPVPALPAPGGQPAGPIAGSALGQAMPPLGTGTPANVGGIGDMTGAAAPGVRWQGPAQVRAGESFTVQLILSPPQPLSSLGYAIGFEPNVLEVLGVTEGTFLRQGNAETTFAPRIDKTTGQVFVTNKRTGPNSGPGATAVGTAVVLSLKATASQAPTTLQLVTLSAQGAQGSSVGLSLPPPLSISVSP